jgi:hypothetical protein
MRTRVLGSIAVACCALALGACGSSGSSSSSGSSGSSGSEVTAFCGKVKDIKQLGDPFASLQPGDVQGAKDAVDKIASGTARLDAAAPAAVKSDVDKIKTSLDDFASQLAGASTPQEVAKAARGFQRETATTTAAVHKLEVYTGRNC